MWYTKLTIVVRYQKALALKWNLCYRPHDLSLILYSHCLALYMWCSFSLSRLWAWLIFYLPICFLISSFCMLSLYFLFLRSFSCTGPTNGIEACSRRSVSCKAVLRLGLVWRGVNGKKGDGFRGLSTNPVCFAPLVKLLASPERTERRKRTLGTLVRWMFRRCFKMRLTLTLIYF